MFWMDAVTAPFEITREQIVSGGAFAPHRRMVGYLALRVTRLSLSQIGRGLGIEWKNVAVGYSSIERRMGTDPALAANVETLMDLLLAHCGTVLDAFH